MRVSSPTSLFLNRLHLVHIFCAKCTNFTQDFLQHKQSSFVHKKAVHNCKQTHTVSNLSTICFLSSFSPPHKQARFITPHRVFRNRSGVHIPVSECPMKNCLSFILRESIKTLDFFFFTCYNKNKCSYCHHVTKGGSDEHPFLL